MDSKSTFTWHNQLKVFLLYNVMLYYMQQKMNFIEHIKIKQNSIYSYQPTKIWSSSKGLVHHNMTNHSLNLS